MKLARIVIHIEGPQLTEQEAMTFCERVDIEEITDKLVSALANIVRERTEPELSELLKIWGE